METNLVARLAVKSPEDRNDVRWEPLLQQSTPKRLSGNGRICFLSICKIQYCLTALKLLICCSPGGLVLVPSTRTLVLGALN
eukprot:2946050-Pyramimonas_sp.AAC.1